jgi:hypothetical protein
LINLTNLLFLGVIYGTRFMMVHGITWTIVVTIFIALKRDVFLAEKSNTVTFFASAFFTHNGDRIHPLLLLYNGQQKADGVKQDWTNHPLPVPASAGRKYTAAKAAHHRRLNRLVIWS